MATHRRPPLQRTPAHIERRLQVNSDSDDDDLFFNVSDPKLKTSSGSQDFSNQLLASFNSNLREVGSGLDTGGSLVCSLQQVEDLQDNNYGTSPNNTTTTLGQLSSSFDTNVNVTQPLQQKQGSTARPIPIGTNSSTTQDVNSTASTTPAPRLGSLRHQQQKQTGSCSSLVDGLLFEIYDRWHYPQRDSFDSDTFTECSSTSDAFFGRSDSLQLAEFEQKHASRYTRTSLEAKDVADLRQLVGQLRHRVNQCSAVLIRQLKRLDRRRAKSHRNYDLVTAILQAASLKRRIDARIRFSVEPLPGDDAFQQWRDAMKAVARLPLGIPQEFRKKVWLALADQHVSNIKLDWEKTTKFAFNEKSNPDDNKLGAQIVKDLHRTGCSGFNGHDNEEDRAVLKRVLLAYARWNKMVGYCQGFNVIAALILDVMDRKEDDALKVMILLIDHVLPDSYFANNLRALSVDMAVFRDLLAIHLPQLSRHLDHLQSAAADDSTGANYEPPLTNVFTMQWFLTLFATCLPKSTALRVWDSVLLEGSEMLFRTALAIWGKLQDRILAVHSADEFYMTMGSLCQEMLDESTSIMDADSVIKDLYAMGPFPLPNLAELREKYTYNITPFTAAMNVGPRPPVGRARGGINIFSDDDDWDEDDIADQINCFAGIFPAGASPGKTRPGELDRAQSYSAFDMSKVSPGAFGSTPQVEAGPDGSGYQERMTMDIDMLKNQYKRLRHRQKQAHVICAAASAARRDQKGVKGTPSPTWMPKARHLAPVFAPPPPLESSVAVNHLFIGRKGQSKNNKNVHEAPKISPLFPQMQRGGVMKSVQVQKRRNKSRSADVVEEPVSAPVTVEKPVVNNDEGGRVVEAMTPSPSRQKQVSRRQSAQSSDSCASEASNNTRDSPISCNAESDSDQGTTEESPSPKAMNGQRDSEKARVEDIGKNRDHLHDSSDSATVAPSDGVDSKPATSPVEVGSIRTQETGEQHRNSLEITKDLENTNQYLAQMVYSRQKKQLLSQEKNNNAKSLSSTLDGSTDDLSGSNRKATSPSGHKTHNPFVIRMNPNRAQTGVRLGLYSADNLPVVDAKIRATREGVKEIGRAQINACLHRQYMAEVRQQARGYKNQ